MYGIKDVQAGERPAAAYVGGGCGLGDLQEPGAAVTVTTFRPGEDQAVLVVAAADPAAVEAHPRPQLGRLLRVVPGRWTRAELQAVRAHLHAHHEERNPCTWGGCTATEHGQAKITASLTRILPEAAAWADSLPTGILDLEPWLTPARSHSRTP